MRFAILILFQFLVQASAQTANFCESFLSLDPGHLVDQLTTKFDMAYPSSGFANASALVEAAKAQGGFYMRAASILENEEFDVAIATNEFNRTQYMTAFKNYHEANSSAGATTSNRDLIESAFLHMNYDDYANLPADSKITYGYVAPKPGTGLASPLGIYSYGRDRWILKMKNIRSRLTLFVGDSLNYLAPTTGAKDRQVKISLDGWSQFFIPWSRRQIIAPLLAQGMSQGRVGLPVQVLIGTEKKIIKPATSAYFQPIAVGDASDGAGVPWIKNYNQMSAIKRGPLKNFRCNHGWGLDYFEVQILGGIDVSDVAAFEYTTNPPTGDFLNWLEAHGIEIRDGRTP